jgi:hypothetical protein
VTEEAVGRLSSEKQGKPLRLSREVRRLYKRSSLQALGGSGVSGLFEVATWLVYAAAAVMMLSVIAGAILAGLGLRLMAEFLRGLGDGREEGDTQHAEDGRRPPA